MMTSRAHSCTGTTGPTIRMAAWRFTLKRSQGVLAGVLLCCVGARRMAIRSHTNPICSACVRCSAPPTADLIEQACTTCRSSTALAVWPQFSMGLIHTNHLKSGIYLSFLVYGPNCFVFFAKENLRF